MSIGPLAPLADAMHAHGVVMLPLPSADMRPGMLLDGDYAVLDYLTDLRDHAGRTFFDGPVALGPLVPASFVLDAVTVKTGGSAHAGASYMGVASARAAAAHSSEVTVKLGPIRLRRLSSGTDALGQPSYLEAADYCTLATAARDWAPFQGFADMMHRRKEGWVWPRSLDIAQALVYAESVEFTFGGVTSAEFDAAVKASAAVDASAGVSVSSEKHGSVTWHNGDAMPLGFLPVHYAYRPADHRFVTVNK